MHTLTTLLSTPLADLRAYWLEERCCGRPKLSPLWFHAARWQGWLLSDLALDHTCRRCGTMPALTLLSQDRVGQPIKAKRIHLVDRFDEH